MNVYRCRGDSCQQGRKPCKTPQACEIPEDEDDSYGLSGVTLALVVAALALWIIWTVFA